MNYCWRYFPVYILENHEKRELTRKVLLINHGNRILANLISNLKNKIVPFKNQVILCMLFGFSLIKLCKMLDDFKFCGVCKNRFETILLPKDYVLRITCTFVYLRIMSIIQHLKLRDTSVLYHFQLFFHLKVYCLKQFDQ